MKQPQREKIGGLLRPLALAGALALAAQGCAHEQVVVRRPGQTETTLTITRSGGSVTLGWQSEAGKLYTLVYASDLGAKGGWQVLPSCQDRPGTGEYVTFQDTVPDTEQRYYRLEVTTPAEANRR